MSIVPQSHSAAEWFATPLGRYVIERELEHVDNAVADVFGYNALQLGLPQHDFLRASRIPFKCCIATEGKVDLRAEFFDLPIASNSVDLLLLPHALEFGAHPHQILREVQRVLMPEGRAVITCFNPWSLWGARRWFGSRRSAYPWCGRFIGLPRLKDWLALLELEIESGRMGCYVPPCTQSKWLHRFRFMDSAGDRWWPIAGGVYFLRVIKRLRGMRVILPMWREQLARRRNLAVVPEKVVGAAAEEPVAARQNVRELPGRNVHRR
jgi:SAM-dependent methyltransferase